MDTNITFDELLANARVTDFYRQQQLLRFIQNPIHQIWKIVSCMQNFLELAEINDSLAATLVDFVQIRKLIIDFDNLAKLIAKAPETTAALLNYAEIRLHIQTFDQLVYLLETVEILKITLPPHPEIRALVKTPNQLEQLSRLRINAHSNGNLAQLFSSYADVRKHFTSFKQLLQFIAHNPSTGQLFIKDEHTISLVRNAKQLNILLKAISKINPLWGKNAALEFSHSAKVVTLFKKEADLLDYLRHLPDQESIKEFVDHHANIADLLQSSNANISMLEMDFFKAKKLRLGQPRIPLNLMQYA
jgi:hypothetical protein